MSTRLVCLESFALYACMYVELLYICSVLIHNGATALNAEAVKWVKSLKNPNKILGGGGGGGA